MVGRSIYYRDDVAVGDRVVTLADVRNFDEILPAGSIGTVVGLGGSHHTANGGGFDVVVSIPGRRWSVFAIDADGHYVVDGNGKYATRPDAIDRLAIRSTSLRHI